MLKLFRERSSGLAPSGISKIVVLGIGFVAAATPALAVEGVALPVRRGHRLDGLLKYYSRAA
jgi:hypothetical protein